MPTIPQSERHGERIAVVYYNESTQTWEQRPLSGDSVGNASVIDGITQVPRYPVAPTVVSTTAGANGVVSQLFYISQSSTNTYQNARIIINAGGDTEASEALSNVTAGVEVCAVGERIVIPSSVAITTVQIILIGDSDANKILTIPGGSGFADVCTWNQAAATIVSADKWVNLTFDEADDVRNVMIYLMPKKSTAPDIGYLFVGGRSYAAE